jgi:hypothetical protein
MAAWLSGGGHAGRMEVALGKSTIESRSERPDRNLDIEEIEAAFTKAGLQTDYQTLVASLGKAGLAEAMTQRWLDLTIGDLLASQGRPRESVRRRERRRVTVPA